MTRILSRPRKKIAQARAWEGQERSLRSDQCRPGLARAIRAAVSMSINKARSARKKNDHFFLNQGRSRKR